MQYLKADTNATVLIGPFLDMTNGVTPETGITLGAADSAEIMKHDGTVFTDISALTFTHVAHGMYTLVITAAHLDTEGRLTVFISDESICLPVWAEFMVVNANVYDSLFAVATTDYLQVDTIQVTGTGQTANDNGADINTILARVIGTLAAGTHNPQTGDAYARLGAPAGASIAADLVVIDNFIDELETRLTAARAGYLDALNGHVAQTGDSFARIGATGSSLTSLAQAAVVGALADVAAAGEVTSADTLMQYLKQLINILIGTPGIATFPAESAPGDAVSLAEVIRAIHADVTGLNGSAMVGTNSAALASVCTEGRLAELDAANIPADVDAILVDTGTTLENRLIAIEADTDELQTDWANDGRLDVILDAAGGAGDPWITALPGAYGVGTAGKIVGDNINAPLDAIPTTPMRGTDNAALASVLGALNNVAAAGDPTDADTLMQYIKQLINVLIGTAGIGAFPAEAAPANAVSLAEVIRAIHVDVTGLNGDAMRGTDGANTTVPDAAGTLATYDPPTKAEMDTAHALLATPAQVNAEVLDVMNVDTFAEPGQATPAATASIFTKINYIYKAWRNKKDNDGTTRNLYNDDAVTVDQKSAVGEAAGVVTTDEWATGP